MVDDATREGELGDIRVIALVARRGVVRGRSVFESRARGILDLICSCRLRLYVD